MKKELFIVCIVNEIDGCRMMIEYYRNFRHLATKSPAFFTFEDAACDSKMALI
jgi:hypothetical protein